MVKFRVKVYLLAPHLRAGAGLRDQLSIHRHQPDQVLFTGRKPLLRPWLTPSLSPIFGLKWPRFAARLPGFGRSAWTQNGLG